MFTSRFASTGTNTLPIGEVEPELFSSTPGKTTNEFSLESLDSIMEDPVLAYDHWGFLKELGLDYGWGPTAFIQSLLENVYIYTGLPWWASLVTTVLVIRIAMLKLYIDANDMATRNGTIKPLMKPLLEKLKEARNNKDPEAMMKVQNERRAINSSAGISMRKSLMPLIQIPLGFGTFRLLRGMGYLPVPGLEVGGALWFKDLTLADPYGILPIATGIFYFYSFKVRAFILGHS